jgi:hypothetical protein
MTARGSSSRRPWLPALAAGVLAVAAFAAGLRWGAMVAGGADSYGYVSQAGLWPHGLPIVRQDIARSSPWPFSAETWAPLGYRPSPHERGALVPIYAPGLPLLMAIAQSMAGYCAAYAVVPACGALTVWLTFILGRRAFADDRVAFFAAGLVATSPTFVYQLMNAMSDVPVTAFATLALVLALGDGKRTTRPGAVERRRLEPLGSGLALSVAIAIRPNLVALALPLAAFLAIRDRGAFASFVVGVVPSIAGIAWLNAALYESALTSGYGTTGDLYAASYVAANARQFALAMVGNEPALVAGAAAAVFARRAAAPGTGLLLGAWAIVVLLSYLFYQPFDAWWYLRFLLPLWPIAMLFSAAAVLAILARLPHRVATAAVALAPACIGIWVAVERGVFDLARGERRYVDVARFVAAHTEPDAVMLSVQHSGSLRLYADRLTLRFVVLDPGWLDRAVEYLESIGRHPYFVLDGGEVEAFRSRFASANRLGRLDWEPAATLGEVVSIYDPLARSGPPPLAIARTRGARRWLNCDAPQSWPPVRRMK